jgi:hypothetical protein
VGIARFCEEEALGWGYWIVAIYTILLYFAILMQRFHPSLIAAKSLGARTISLPCWWYTRGLRERIVATRRGIGGCGRILQLKILFKNLLSPLYGFQDWETRLVSLIVRPGHFVCVLVIVLAYTLMYIIPLALWALAPPFVLYSLGYQLDFWRTDLYAPLQDAILFLFF